MLKGIASEVKSIRVVGEGTELDWDIKMKRSWSEVPGVIYIDVPEGVLDDEVTVLAMQLTEPIELYRDGVEALESN